MSGWRDQILDRFTVDVSRLTLALDPDGLLREERLADGVRSKGFDIISFDDAVSFRYTYESKYRSRWDLGRALDSSVVVIFDADDPRTVPYDLLNDGRLLSLSLGDLFPNLSYPVVSALDRADLDSLYTAQRQQNPDTLGNNSTKDFILRYVFGIAPEIINTSSDLLRVLLRKHYTAQRVPQMLDERFTQVLRHKSGFDDWPLEEIVPQAELFYAFLQERLMVFVRKKLEDGEMAVNDEAGGSLAFQGPAELPFGHDDVRVYIDDLLADGYLHRIKIEGTDAAGKLTARDNWLAMGIEADGDIDSASRLRELIEGSDQAIPSEDCSYQDWLLFAHRWAQTTARFLRANVVDDVALTNIIQSVRNHVDSSFASWMLRKYIGLHNQPPLPPVMVHHIPRFLARQIEDSPGTRVALAIIDGMSYDQWMTMRDVLADQESRLLFGENAVFAWVPTITSVSRQAIVAGKPPLLFPSTIGTTDAEPRLWQQFWSDHGLSATQVAYVKGVGEDNDLISLSELAAEPRIHVLAVVVDKLDKIMHGMELGAAGMQNQVLHWASQGFLRKMIQLLANAGFRVFLSSDHGNVECRGIGRPSEGSVADLRGERVRIYRNPELRSLSRSQLAETLEWPTLGLPDDYFALLASGRNGFVSRGQTLVSHGGISLEEVIVPLVEVKRRQH